MIEIRVSIPIKTQFLVTPLLVRRVKLIGLLILVRLPHVLIPASTIVFF